MRGKCIAGRSKAIDAVRWHSAQCEQACDCAGFSVSPWQGIAGAPMLAELSPSASTNGIYCLVITLDNGMTAPRVPEMGNQIIIQARISFLKSSLFMDEN